MDGFLFLPPGHVVAPQLLTGKYFGMIWAQLGCFCSLVSSDTPPPEAEKGLGKRVAPLHLWQMSKAHPVGKLGDASEDQLGIQALLFCRRALSSVCLLYTSPSPRD